MLECQRCTIEVIFFTKKKQQQSLWRFWNPETFPFLPAHLKALASISPRFGRSRNNREVFWWTPCEASRNLTTSGSGELRYDWVFTRHLGENKVAIFTTWLNIIICLLNYMLITWWIMGIYGGFPKWGYPKIDGLRWKIPLKWMIGGYPYCIRKPPNRDIMFFFFNISNELT